MTPPLHVWTMSPFLTIFFYRRASLRQHSWESSFLFAFCIYFILHKVSLNFRSDLTFVFTSPSFVNWQYVHWFCLNWNFHIPLQHLNNVTVMWIRLAIFVSFWLLGKDFFISGPIQLVCHLLWVLWSFSQCRQLSISTAFLNTGKKLLWIAKLTKLTKLKLIEITFFYFSCPISSTSIGTGQRWVGL